MDQHGLQRLAVHVHGLLAEIGPAAREVVHGGFGGEVARTVANYRDCLFQVARRIAGDGLELRASAVQLPPQPAGNGGVVDANAAVPEPALQFGGGAARVVQRQQFEGVPVEARHRKAVAPPRARLLPEARGFGGGVEGLAVARTRQARHPAGRGSVGSAAAVVNGKCTGGS